MNYYGVLALVLFCYMTFWFIVSFIRKRNDVADVAWGLGFVLLTWVSFFLSTNLNLRVLLVNILVSAWGIRLALHIHKRNKGRGEDYRYLAWRKAWGKYFYLRSYGQVYLFQGVLLFIIALPILIINKNSNTHLGLADYMGLFIWFIGFFFESVADYQLLCFIKNPENKGRLMQQGLWQYSRHPNYFGEVILWWGLGCVALNTPQGWFSMVGPATITFLIIKVSGIPLLEKNMAKHPDYAEYKRRTSIFFPLPRKPLLSTAL